MPMYTYKCVTEGCECVESKLVKLSERETSKFDCPECKTSQSLQYISFIPGQKLASCVFKGRGFREGY